MASGLAGIDERLVSQPNLLEERGDDLIAFRILFREGFGLFGGFRFAHHFPLFVDIGLPQGDVGGFQKDFLRGDRLDQSVQHFLQTNMHTQRVMNIDGVNGFSSFHLVQFLIDQVDVGYLFMKNVM